MLAITPIQELALVPIGVAIVAAVIVRLTISAGSRLRLFLFATMTVLGLINIFTAALNTFHGDPIARLAVALVGLGAFAYAAHLLFKPTRWLALAWKLSMGLGLAMAALSYVLRG